MKKLFKLHEESKNAQIKVTKPLQHLSHKFDYMEKENKKKDEKICKLEEKIYDLESENKGFSESTDELEQYSRRNCLFLHEINKESHEHKDDRVIKSLTKDV